MNDVEIQTQAPSRGASNHRYSLESMRAAGWSTGRALLLLKLGFRVRPPQGQPRWLDRASAARQAVVTAVADLPAPIGRELLREVADRLGELRHAHQPPTDPPEACP